MVCPTTTSTLGSSTPTHPPRADSRGWPTAVAQIWEAILVEVLDRTLSLAGRGEERETEWHRARVVLAERTGAVLGLRRSSLVTLL